MPKTKPKAEGLEEQLTKEVRRLKTEILFLKGYAENRHVFQGTAVDDVCRRCLEGIARIETTLECLKLRGA